jgi:hypothetical protein
MQPSRAYFSVCESHLTSKMALNIYRSRQFSLYLSIAALLNWSSNISLAKTLTIYIDRPNFLSGFKWSRLDRCTQGNIFFSV